MQWYRSTRRIPRLRYSRRYSGSQIITNRPYVRAYIPTLHSTRARGFRVFAYSLRIARCIILLNYTSHVIRSARLQWSVMMPARKRSGHDMRSRRGALSLGRWIMDECHCRSPRPVVDKHRNRDSELLLRRSEMQSAGGSRYERTHLAISNYYDMPSE